MIKSITLPFELLVGLLLRLVGRVVLVPIMNNVPRKWKRIIYVSSILGLTNFIRHPDYEILMKLNQICNLARSENDLITPSFIRNIIWTHILNSEIQTASGPVRFPDMECRSLSSVDVSRIAEYLVEHTPKWLVYGSQNIMSYDARMALSMLRSHQQKNIAFA